MTEFLFLVEIVKVIEVMMNKIITLEQLQALYKEYRRKHDEGKYEETVFHFAELCKQHLITVIKEQAETSVLISYERIGFDKALKKYDFLKREAPLDRLEYDLENLLRSQGFYVEWCRPHTNRRDNDLHIRISFNPN